MLAPTLILLVAMDSPGPSPPSSGPAVVQSTPEASAGDRTPRDPKSPVPGVADGRGPTGPVSLRILRPAPDEEIPLPGEVASGAEVHVAFDLKDYETFFDTATRSGQGVAIILDGLPFFSHYDVSKPWVFRKVPPGPHTLRAVPIRPWGEPIREDGAFAMVTFRVGPRTDKMVPGSGEPALVVFSPRQQGKYSATEAASLKFHFLVRGCRVSEEKAPDTCRVRYRIDDRPEVILSSPEGAPLDGLSVGRHGFSVGLTRDGKLIPGAFALVQLAFEVTETAR